MLHFCRYGRSILVVVFVLVQWSILVLAQTTTTGAIEGQVREEGSPTQFVAKATVKVRNEETGLEVVAVTDAGDD